ncbi:MULTISPECIES: response regulator [Flavobacterium]|uniref:Response regulator n=1 Tax=Flavobacterium endoglycinae TaxID=2816357 RepID=A0ABX7QDF6_9FLAO|nr:MULTISPECIES: response regulator [Flavobacterium]QSW88436.1 response regulator [Flavobacterium endoglycinae]
MLEKHNSTKIIYHADDDEDDRMLFTDAVDELALPVRVQQASDGQQLLDILLRNTERLPDIVFLDINMPFRNGFECLEEIRRGKVPLREVKVVMLSTSGSPENIARAFELGADLYAVKPSSYQGLKELLSEILGVGKKQDREIKSGHKVYSSPTWLL